jgi:hypothetical protein
MIPPGHFCWRAEAPISDSAAKFVEKIGDLIGDFC